MATPAQPLRDTSVEPAGRDDARRPIRAVPYDPPAPRQARMVGWYDPAQLAKTGVEVAVSTLFGRHSDHRLVEAMTAGDTGERFYDYTYQYVDDSDAVCSPDPQRPRDSIWVDYVGDVGDGWNSTYAVACQLAAPQRRFEYEDPETRERRTVETARGDILIFGGDEVYPTPSQEEYRQRLVAPYDTAMRRTAAPHPHVFAIPGNHDWYDSLVAFNRLFTSRRWFAGWRTRQARSYFALKLPHNWWLLGTDVQLGSDLDRQQVEYFEGIAAEMHTEAERTGKPAGVILCHAEPHWIRAAQYGSYDPNYSESNLSLLEQRLGKDVAVFIAGDLHHYRRHEAEDKSTQKITAGGGGAFLHPTHCGRRGTSLDRIVETRSNGHQAAPPRADQIFDLKASFPTPRVSRRLCWRNLVFPYLPGSGNRLFGIATAAVYLLLTLGVVGGIDGFEPLSASPLTTVGFALQHLLQGGVTALLMLLTIAGFWMFTDTHSPRYRMVMGGLHGVFHVLSAFGIAVLTLTVVTSHMSAETWRWNDFNVGAVQMSFDARLVVAILMILLLGYIVGPIVFGTYLLLSLNFFGRHSNEAFSSLAIEDWKNFLRLHIDARGDLTIFPIGIERVPRRWKRRDGTTGPEWVSDDPRATAPELIEPPIVIKRNAAMRTGVQAVCKGGT